MAISQLAHVAVAEIVKTVFEISVSHTPVGGQTMKRYCWSVILFAQTVFVLGGINVFTLPGLAEPLQSPATPVQQVRSSVAHDQRLPTTGSVPTIRPNASEGFKTTLLSYITPPVAAVTSQAPQADPGLPATQ